MHNAESLSFDHEGILGFDLKHTNSTVEYVDKTSKFGHRVNLFQVVIGYNCKWEKTRPIAEAGADLYCSPVHWLPDQSKSDFSSLRPKAKNKWIRMTAFLNYKLYMPRSFIYIFSINGQWCQQALIPSEQIGLGGYNSIRGYEERQFNADSGFCATSELHFPSFSFFHKNPSTTDKMTFLVFLDAGYGSNTKKIHEIKRHNYLVGAGPGVRFSLGSYLIARCDWGFKIHHRAPVKGGGNMVHFSVTGSY